MSENRAMRAVTRPHNLDDVGPYLEYVRRATETASFVSVQNDIHNRYGMHHALYKRLRVPDVISVITQGCMAVGVAAAKNITDKSPTIRNPGLILNNQNWRLNPIGGAYVARCNLGTLASPRNRDSRLKKRSSIRYPLTSGASCASGVIRIPYRIRKI